MRRALAFGDSLEDERLGNAPETGGHRRLPPLRHVERHGSGKLIGVNAAFRLDGACGAISQQRGHRRGVAADNLTALKEWRDGRKLPNPLMLWEM